MPILASDSLLRENLKKHPVKNVTPSGNRTWGSHNLWFQVQHPPFLTKLTSPCKTGSLGPLYIHALLILTESSKSKNQVEHEQKFKELLSSTCQVSPERTWNVGLGIRDLYKVQVLFPLGVTFYHWIFYVFTL